MLSTPLQKMMTYVSRFGQYAAELIKAINSGGLYGGGAVIPKATSYTVLATENGAQYNTFGASGAVTFTLPTIALGLSYTFVNVVDQNMVIAFNSLGIADGSITAASATFSTSSHKRGSAARVVAIDSDGAGTLKWLFQNIGGTTATIA